MHWASGVTLGKSVINLKHKLGIALGGGGARGTIHIGVLKALRRHRIKIDAVSGTSAGSVVAASYCCGTIRELENFIINVTRKEIFSMLDPVFLQGVLGGKRLEEWLEKITLGKKFEDLKIPLAINATDIRKGKQFVFRKGDIAKAIVASCSYPGIFAPVKYRGMLLADGGILNKVPVDILPSLGADIVIGVNVTGYEGMLPASTRIINRGEFFAEKFEKIRIERENAAKIRKYYSENRIAELRSKNKPVINLKKKKFHERYSAVRIVADSLILNFPKRNCNYEKNSDLMISPKFSGISSFDFLKGREAIALGRECAEREIPVIRRMLKEF
ncbi:MAG: patatin-like phospholipase family protein [Candidatus Woesearchaeota archaeon]|nr:patatin-like phospholipase family protein [Candidatus Woesearchaeota archaeon]